MIRVLLTGISGTGKSSLIREIAARGYKAVDLDDSAWSRWSATDPNEDPSISGTPVEPDRDWVWREDQVNLLLDTEDTDVLFVSGCAINQRKFLARFDLVILLCAPRSVIAQRLTTRTTNDYGKRPDKLDRVLSLIDTVEISLQESADHCIDTNQPMSVVVERILGFIRTS